MSTAIGEDASQSSSLGGISQRAFEKWWARGQPSGTSLLDWLEAESELRQLESLLRRIEELEQQLADQLAESHRLQSRLETEHAVTRILGNSGSLREAASLILQSICEQLGYGVGVLWIVDRRDGVLRCEEVFQVPAVDVGDFTAATRELTFLWGEGLPGRVWASQSPSASPDVAADASSPRNAAAASTDLHGAVAFPVRNGVEFLGVMEFFGREVGEPDRESAEMMASIASQFGQFIERHDAEAARRRELEERHVAGRIQQRLLPQRQPELPGYDISGRCVSAFDVGGDCFDFFPMMLGCDDCLGVLVADGSGHGLASSLLVAETRAYIRALAMTCPDVDRLLKLVNQRMTDDLEREGFVTAMLLRLAPCSGIVVYANAGHCPGIVFDQEGQVRAGLAIGGFPLGVEPSAEFSAQPTRLGPGESVLLYSDGVIEAFSRAGELFGVKRLCQVVSAHRDESSEGILNAVYSEVDRFQDGAALRDDVTVVVIRRDDPEKRR
jgi:serine phosphatase RsbU (regulator of sigma subunit)